MAELISTTDSQDMDAGAMVRRAYERGETLEEHDPNQLVQDVAELLRQQGLHPELPPGTGRLGMATGAAGMLLRAFGILPAANWRVRDQVNCPDPESR